MDRKLEFHWAFLEDLEGFIAGLFERFTGKTYHVKEIDCWCTGDRTCRFCAELVRT